MRFACVVALFVLLVPFSANAQEQEALTFSNPPAGMPDFSDWGSQRNFQGDDVPVTGGPLEQVVIGSGLCRTDTVQCTVSLQFSFSFLNRCIAQDDQEFDCRRRMAWKKRETIAAVGRYVMVRAGKRVEGFVLERELTDARYFIRATGETEWRELSVQGPAAPRTEQEELFTALYLLSKR